MGLDAVELVMEIEDRFGVKLLESEVSRVRTVADLAAAVINRLPRSEDGCPVAREFYSIRRQFIEHAGLDRKRIRPSTHLTELFSPSSRRRVWKRLRAANPRLPRLVASDRIDRMTLWGCGVIFMLVLFVTPWVWITYGAVFGIAIPILFVVIITTVPSLFTRHFPSECRTVGDVARRLAPVAVPFGAGGGRVIAILYVVDEVRRLTADVLGVELEKVRPESDFVNDLRMG